MLDFGKLCFWNLTAVLVIVVVKKTLVAQQIRFGFKLLFLLPVVLA